MYLLKYLIFHVITKCIIFSGAVSVALSGALKGVLFRKMLRISAAGRLGYSSGNLTNLFNVDIDRVVAVLISLHYFWVLPIEVSTGRERESESET